MALSGQRAINGGAAVSVNPDRLSRLALTRSAGESVRIGDDIEVKVARVGVDRRAHLLVTAPRNLPVFRTELLDLPVLKGPADGPRVISPNAAYWEAEARKIAGSLLQLADCSCDNEWCSHELTRLQFESVDGWIDSKLADARKAEGEITNSRQGVA